LGMLGELGYGFAYRVLDAQFFGVAQRRRRVFVVGCLGDWRRAAAVLFERHSLSGHPAPRREARQRVASGSADRAAFGGNNTSGPIDVATALNACASASGRMDFGSETFVAHFLRGDGAILVPMVAPTLQAGGNSAGGDRPPGTTVDTCESLIPVGVDFQNCASTG